MMGQFCIGPLVSHQFLNEGFPFMNVYVCVCECLCVLCLCLCVCFLQTKMQQLIGLLNDTHITFENGLDVQSLKEDYVKLCESLFQMHKRYFSTNHYLHV